MKNVTIISLILLAAVSITVIGTMESCSQADPDNEEHHSWVHFPEGYVGSDQCANCHQQQFDDWMGSHHQLAMLPANNETVLGDFSGKEFLQDGNSVRYFKSGEKFMVNAMGADGVNRDFEVLFTFGVEPLQQYLVEAGNGKLQALTVAWNTEKKQWMDLYPDLEVHHKEWLSWSGNSMTWNAMCADCHSTAYRKNFDIKTDHYASTWSEVNVACEACHGPGKEHIELAEMGRDSRASLFMRTDVAQKELVDACAPCHSRRSVINQAFDPSGKYLDNFDPALITPRLYHADGQIDDEVYVYGSFRQSKMYHRGVKCIDCHDPHTADLKVKGNDLCASCHAPADYNVFGHTMHEEGSAGAQCINCHMPGKFYMVNDYRHDHSFRAPRPDLGVKYGTPDACTNCHVDRSQQWAADVIEAHYGPERIPHFSDVLLAADSRTPEDIAALAAASADTAVPSFVRASMIGKLGTYNDGNAFNAIVRGLEDEEPLVRIASINALGYLPQNDRINTITPHLRDEHRAVRIAAARNMADIHGRYLRPDYAESLSQALVELRLALDANMDMRDGRFSYGMYLEKIGQPELAVKTYEECLEIDHFFNNARLNASAVLNSLGRNQEAKKHLEEFVAQEPENAHAHFALGLLQAELNNMLASLTSLARATQLDSTQSRYWYNYGLALDRTEDKGAAEKAYYNALSIDPNSVPALKALTILYWQLNMKNDAMIMVERLEELVPQDPEVLRIAAQLREDLGTTP